jgi:hypothetical protein
MSRPSLPSTPLPGTPTLRVPSPTRTPSPLPLFSGGGPYSYSGQITRKYAARFTEIDKTKNIVREAEEAWEKEAKGKGMDLERLAKRMEKDYVWEEKTATRIEHVFPAEDTTSLNGEREEAVDADQKKVDLKVDKRLSRLSLEEDNFVDALTSPISEKPRDWPELSASDET